jgi:hypothetical protein
VVDGFARTRCRIVRCECQQELFAFSGSLRLEHLTWIKWDHLIQVRCFPPLLPKQIPIPSDRDLL